MAQSIQEISDKTRNSDINSETIGIFENIFDFFGMLDANGNVLWLRGKVFDEINVDPDLLKDQKFSETVFWQSSENTAGLLDKAIRRSAAGQVVRELLNFRLTADNKFAIEVTLQPLDGTNRDGRIFISAQHVSERESRVEYYKQDVEELLFAAENAEIGLWYWDLVDSKIFSTPKCNELFDLPAYDVLTYEKFIERVHPDDRDRVEQSLQKAHVNGTKYNEEYRIVYSDGRIEWLSCEGKSFLDPNGNPQKMTSVVRKITEQKLANEELSKVYDREKKARDEAVEANRAKDFFLAFVSHELRSPLNAILGWAKILLTKTLDEETRKNALQTIERSARVQTKLINDLVDSARVASGKLRLEYQPANLYEILNISYHSQKPSAEAQGVKFEFIAKNKDVTLFGDAGRLQQVFTNLISNAIKFTPEGGHVSIELDTDPTSAIVRVRDNGIGISPDALPNIFRQFSQGDIGSERQSGGLGLGLSIVNILVAKHGGTVKAESKGLGQGALFTVRLPVTRSVTAAVEQHVAASIDRKPLQGIKILLVEDDSDSREVLQLFLDQSGATTMSAASAKTAVALLKTSVGNLPDVIISDLAMPDEDGYTMMSRIRAMEPESGGRIPALALSAFATNESKQRALESGFQLYNTKPFEPDLIVHDIRALLGRN
ncbi:MAG TPA: ATP-binding protein [Pyrinomonadaceae bacterium]|nr:ATP-binding protein [Pyrinomonadaceae bacterium]